MAGTAVVLTACGSQPAADPAAPVPISEAAATDSASPSTSTSDPSATTESTEPSESSGSSTDELAAQLLPASAFGEGADVVALPGDVPGWWWWGHDGDDHDGDDHDGWWGDHGWWGSADGTDDDPDGTGIEPAACADALAALPDLPDEQPDAAGQVATTDTVRTFQVIADSPALADLDVPVDQLLANCSQVTFTGWWGMSATISVTPLDVPARGESTTALAITMTSPAGAPSGLVGVVTQGSKVMMLAQTAKGDAAPDQAAFATLLGQAADAASFD